MASADLGLRNLPPVGRDQRTVSAEQIDSRAAKRFFEEFEHLGDCGLGVWHYRVTIDGDLAGVVSFGTTCFSRTRGQLARIAFSLNVPIYQIARGGTSHRFPFNTASQVLSCAIRAFRYEHGDCLLVAYADRHFNEMGTIYQACNAIYTGKTDPKGQSNYIINGRWMSGWTVRKTYKTRAMHTLLQIDPTSIRVPLTAKYRYIFAVAGPGMKRKMEKALAALSRPYPKRNTERIPPMDIGALIAVRHSKVGGILDHVRGKTRGADRRD